MCFNAVPTDGGVPFGYLRLQKEAFASFDKAVEYKPDDAVAWLNWGLAWEKLERYSEAIASYDFKPDCFKP